MFVKHMLFLCMLLPFVASSESNDVITTEGSNASTDEDNTSDSNKIDDDSDSKVESSSEKEASAEDKDHSSVEKEVTHTKKRNHKKTHKHRHSEDVNSNDSSASATINLSSSASRDAANDDGDEFSSSRVYAIVHVTSGGGELKVVWYLDGKQYFVLPHTVRAAKDYKVYSNVTGRQGSWEIKVLLDEQEIGSRTFSVK